MALTITAFRKIVYNHYKKYGRDFPWRHTKNPYHIFISEIMLQQTQADRVVDKYALFIHTFPTIQSLSQTSTKKLYGIWKGLGYNRRALALKKAAKIIVNEYKGKIPKDQDALESLPGIGPYTASAILAFAFNKPSMVIETNIRTVFIYHFFKNKTCVPDVKLIPLIEKMVDQKNARLWYTALMDYGAALKKEFGNISRRSAHHSTQSPFKGSRRQLRGEILRLLDAKTQLSIVTLVTAVKKSKDEVTSVLHDLEKEGFIKKARSLYTLK